MYDNGREAQSAWCIRGDVGCKKTGNTVYENGILSLEMRGILAGNECLIDSNVSLTHTYNLSNGTGCVLVNNIAP